MCSSSYIWQGSTCIFISTLSPRMINKPMGVHWLHLLGVVSQNHRVCSSTGNRRLLLDWQESPHWLEILCFMNSRAVNWQYLKIDTWLELWYTICAAWWRAYRLWVLRFCDKSHTLEAATPKIGLLLHPVVYIKRYLHMNEGFLCSGFHLSTVCSPTSTYQSCLSSHWLHVGK